MPPKVGWIKTVLVSTENVPLLESVKLKPPPVLVATNPPPLYAAKSKPVLPTTATNVLLSFTGVAVGVNVAPLVCPVQMSVPSGLPVIGRVSQSVVG